MDEQIPGLEYEVADRVAYLTINRPDKLNSLNEAMYAGLRTYVIRADLDDDVEIIVLRSTGDRAFCTGGDLVEGVGTWGDGNGLAERLGDLDGKFPFTAFERCSKTILTAVNGLAQAAGLITVLVSDLVIASDQARFRVPETRRGLTEPYIPRRLAQTIGLARARWMIYTAEEIDAAQALACGLVAKVVPHAQLDQAVAQAISALRRTGPQSRAHYKRMINQTLPVITLDEFLLSMRSAEAIEGMRSFAEKRPPAWDQDLCTERSDCVPNPSESIPGQAPTRRFWNPEIQTLPRAELEALQLKRLQEAVGIAYDRAPFFRGRFDAAGIKPGDIASVADLRRMPPFGKADLRADEAAYPPVGRYRASGLRGAVRLATSTGTTGRATYVLFTRHDIGVENELGARNFWRLGYRPGDVVVNAHPGYLNGGQANVGGVMEHLGCLSISIGPPEDDDRIIDALRRLDGLAIDHWQLMPAAAVRIREAAGRRGWTGVLPPMQDATPLLQLDLISAGMECVGFLGSTCRPGLGTGAHVAEDYALIEALDPVTGQPVPDGARGYLVCTSLGRDNPMIRYNLEDVVRIDRSPCDCGETHLRAWWDGRGKDVVMVAGRAVLPLDVWRHLSFDAQYVLLRRAHEMDRLEIRLEGAPPQDLAARIEAGTGVPVHVAPIPAGSLARSSYKFERVIDVDEGEPA